MCSLSLQAVDLVAAPQVQDIHRPNLIDDECQSVRNDVARILHSLRMHDNLDTYVVSVPGKLRGVWFHAV